MIKRGCSIQLFHSLRASRREIKSRAAVKRRVAEEVKKLDCSVEGE